MWKAIDGYRFPYRINEEGEIQRQLPDGSWRKIKSWLDHGSGYRLSVNLAVDGGYQRRAVCKLMEGRFIRRGKPGEVITYKNGMRSDCTAWNLIHATKAEINRKVVARRKMRAVEKVDKNGEVIGVYKSIGDAAKENFASRNYISSRCRKVCKKLTDEQGCSYRYAR